MDYKEKYEQALEALRSLFSELAIKHCDRVNIKDITNIFSELKESEDEKIRKALIRTFNGKRTNEHINGVLVEDILAWLERQADTQKKIDRAYAKGLADAQKALEKQGEQKPAEEYNITSIGSKNAQGKLGEMIKKLKPVNEVLEQKSADKVEPKFKVGDWIVAISSGNLFKILSVHNGLYKVLCEDGIETNYPFKEVDKDLRLWTIQDAKDGDVLADKSDGTIGIFQNIGHHPDGGSYNDPSYCFLHCRYDDGYFYADFENGNTMDSNDVIPATKEQRDTLERAMTNAGYRWNKEELKLEKI